MAATGMTGSSAEQAPTRCWAAAAETGDSSRGSAHRDSKRQRIVSQLWATRSASRRVHSRSEWTTLVLMRPYHRLGQEETGGNANDVNRRSNDGGRRCKLHRRQFVGDDPGNLRGHECGRRADHPAADVRGKALARAAEMDG